MRALVQAVRPLHEPPKYLPVDVSCRNMERFPQTLQCIQQQATLLPPGNLQALRALLSFHKPKYSSVLHQQKHDASLIAELGILHPKRNAAEKVETHDCRRMFPSLGMYLYSLQVDDLLPQGIKGSVTEVLPA